MPHPQYTAAEVAARAEALYEQRIRSEVESQENAGNFLVIDIESGDYEIDDSHLAASDRAAAKHPGASLYAMRVGHPTAGRIGMKGISQQRVRQ